MENGFISIPINGDPTFADPTFADYRLLMDTNSEPRGIVNFF
jgi:hypothetical protein